MDPRTRLLQYECEPASVHVPQAIVEMNTAEDNWARVQQAAVKVKAVLDRLPGADFQTKALDTLIHDLNTIYSFIRFQISKQYPREANSSSNLSLLRNRRLANPANTPWPHLEAHPCVCPLTVFLQAVARSLTNLRINIEINYQKAGISPKDPKEGWGKIKPLRDILITLKNLTEVRIPRDDGPDYILTPGIAQCLMFHEEHSAYVVTSSAVRYNRLVGLQEFGRATRRNYIQRMRGKFPPETERRIQEVEVGSRALFDHYNRQKTRKAQGLTEEQWHNPFAASGIAPVKINGQSATFDPNGHYKVACLIDFCRFVIDKPMEAAIREEKESKKGQKARMKNNTAPKRPGFPEDSCAEWEMWITVLSSDQAASAAKTTPPRPVARRDGQQRSDTYPPRPTPQVASKRPSHPSLQFQASVAQQKVTPPKPTKAPSRPAQGAYNQQYLSPQPPGSGHHGKPGYASSSSRTPSPGGYVRPEPMQIGQPKPRKKQSSGCC